jgi:hypothetical protein
MEIMSKNKENFSDGEWHAALRDSYTCGGDMVEIVLLDDNGMVINQIASVLLDTDNEKELKEQEANCILLAAAPKLFRALKVMLDQASDGQMIAPSTIEMARAALDKATNV